MKLDVESPSDDLAVELLDHIEMLRSVEPSFGHATALLKYGQHFLPRGEKTAWLRIGTQRACFNNAAAYAITRNDVLYAEGYAFEPGLPMPVQHAWLVNLAGEVIDPTWDDTKDHVYFGIPFRRSFVAETLEANNQKPGILVNMHLLRRRLRSPEAVEQAIALGRANDMPVHDFSSRTD